MIQILLARCQGRRDAARRIGEYAAPIAAAAALTAGLLSPMPAAADGLPAEKAPSGFRSVDNAAGGRILDGTLAGVHSTQEAVHSGLHKLSAYFGGTLEVRSAVRSKDNKVTTAFFSASLHGTPVTGLSIIAFAPKDASREAVLFDMSDGFKKSLPSLTERLKSLPLPGAPASGKAGGGGGAAPHASIPTLHPQMAPDGTVGISIPSDWQVKVMQSGRVIVAGPNKQRVAMNSAVGLIDPNSQRVRMAQQTAQFTHTKIAITEIIAPYSKDIAQDFKNAFEAGARAKGEPDPEVHFDTVKPNDERSAFLVGTKLESGVKMRFSGLASAQTTVGGAWNLSWWMVFDTVDNFKQDVPLLMAIQKSCTYNAAKDRQVKAAETKQIVDASNREIAASKERHETFMAGQDSRFRSSMAAARATQDSIDRSAAGMIHVINGTSVLEHTDTGARGSFDSGFADAVARQDPDHFRVVPMKEFRKGIDY